MRMSTIFSRLHFQSVFLGSDHSYLFIFAYFPHCPCLAPPLDEGEVAKGKKTVMELSRGTRKCR